MALKDGAILQTVPQNIHLHFRKKKTLSNISEIPISASVTSKHNKNLGNAGNNQQNGYNIGSKVK